MSQGSVRALASLLALASALSPLLAAQETMSERLLGVLPAEGLDRSSVFVFREQSALDAHYLLADETVLGLGENTAAVLARYAAGPGEALLLVVSYPSEGPARSAYERFGRDFFAKKFDGRRSRTVELLENGDYAAAARVRSYLIVVLEAPDRRACDELLRRAEKRAAAKTS